MSSRKCQTCGQSTGIGTKASEKGRHDGVSKSETRTDTSLRLTCDGSQLNQPACFGLALTRLSSFKACPHAISSRSIHSSRCGGMTRVRPLNTTGTLITRCRPSVNHSFATTCIQRIYDTYTTEVGAWKEFCPLILRQLRIPEAAWLGRAEIYS